MTGRFQVPTSGGAGGGGNASSSPPSTPDRSSSRSSAAFFPRFADSTASAASHPSTTPAGPPPPSSHRHHDSSVASFTPAGAPSASYLGSSIMRGMTGGSRAGTGTETGAGQGLLFNSKNSEGKRNLFAGVGAGVGVGVGGSSGGRKKAGKNVPLGRSIRQKRGPSGLGRSVDYDDDDDEGEVQVEEGKSRRGGAAKTFGVPFDDSYDYDDGEDEEGGREEGEEEDMWLDMSAAEKPAVGDESDLLMLATPAATERVRREAEDIFRASAMQAGGASHRREFRYAALAKDVYTQLGIARITEPPHVILGTESLIAKLYDEGVGEAEDEQKMDDALATVAGKVAALWKGYVDKLPVPTEEHAAEIGPGPHATPFEKANYLANLALQIHHTRYDEDGPARAEPLPQTLFRWLNEYHDMYGNQVEEILRYRPSPACHSLFWQAVFIALVRGKVADAARLLKQAGWGHVRRGPRGEYAYVGRALENVQRATEETIAVLESCPGYDDNWEIWSSDWTLFRVRAQGALEHLRRFAEGKDTAFGDSTFTGSVSSVRSRQSMAGLARRAESQVPWDIYENLNVVFDIVLGQQTAILEAAQDWLEATCGLFGWWDERKAQSEKSFSMSQSLPGRQDLLLASIHTTDKESYLDRLAHAFHAAMESDFHFNSQNPVEIGMACIFEGNTKALIGLLRGWSLPIASAVAEIASLGKWLPPHRPSGVFAFEDLDMDDLEVLGVDPGAPDEIDGIKDSTLIQYAQTLADCGELSTPKDKAGVRREGWELAISVLGRIDSPQRSEEMVRDLVRHVIQQLHVDSNTTVDKLWTLLNELGMVPMAEDTAETYGEILARDSHRYGEAMWYYALAHRPNKVREVMNLLISYSLIQSTAFPPANELDDYLHRLLTDRKKTLEQCADKDIEAAELLGKMLSGYASLRQFYEIRDNEDALPTATPQARRQQAATALISVIASSDDNIRGGLFDQTRDGIVSEDFLLALLGERSCSCPTRTTPTSTTASSRRPSSRSTRSASCSRRSRTCRRWAAGSTTPATNSSSWCSRPPPVA
ncbi:hypothetical protein VTK56DRAFT_5095 [Thermocarpiscus australiensis]